MIPPLKTKVGLVKVTVKSVAELEKKSWVGQIKKKHNFFTIVDYIFQ
jgi:hypothetical protein